MADEAKLQSLRERIDAVDAQLLKLISERGGLAHEVAEAKLAAGETPNFYRPEREAQVLRRIIENNPGPLPDEEMARLFREIMSACLALEKQRNIAFLGPEGTFTQAAALKHFGHSVQTTPLAAIDEIFREVQSGAADYGVVPVENSTEGVINHTLDMFLKSSLQICGEVDLRVHHCLMGRMDDVTSIQRLFSHQQSLAQCREWLDAHLPNVERVPVSSNAEAARQAADSEGVAAIASEIAADLYGLKVLYANIEDEPNNTTRFLIIGKEDTPPSGVDKTSLMVSARNKSGALASLLEPLASSQISMTRIESRPSRMGMWEYVFFIDIEGHRQDEKTAVALDKLRQEAAVLRVLGSYPKAVL